MREKNDLNIMYHLGILILTYFTHLIVIHFM